mmetsp:Transcript_1781/g.6575  ORF Transcript_1781/g.6575 Transcript_1781/m.6575 type:complete len:300 (+) Transcript_1781:294-1193(+)
MQGLQGGAHGPTGEARDHFGRHATQVPRPGPYSGQKPRPADRPGAPAPALQAVSVPGQAPPEADLQPHRGGPAAEQREAQGRQAQQKDPELPVLDRGRGQRAERQEVSVRPDPDVPPQDLVGREHGERRGQRGVPQEPKDHGRRAQVLHGARRRGLRRGERRGDQHGARVEGGRVQGLPQGDEEHEEEKAGQTEARPAGDEEAAEAPHGQGKVVLLHRDPAAARPAGIRREALLQAQQDQREVGDKAPDDERDQQGDRGAPAADLELLLVPAEVPPAPPEGGHAGPERADPGHAQPGAR